MFPFIRWSAIQLIWAKLVVGFFWRFEVFFCYLLLVSYSISLDGANQITLTKNKDIWGCVLSTHLIALISVTCT